MANLDTVSVIAAVALITQQQLCFIVIATTQLTQLHTQTASTAYRSMRQVMSDFTVTAVINCSRS